MGLVVEGIISSGIGAMTDAPCRVTDSSKVEIFVGVTDVTAANEFSISMEGRGVILNQYLRVNIDNDHLVAFSLAGCMDARFQVTDDGIEPPEPPPEGTIQPLGLNTLGLNTLGL